MTGFLAITAPVLTVIQCYLQAKRIRIAGANGVALGTWILSIFCGEIWISYGILYSVPAEWESNGAFLILALWVSYLAAKAHKHISHFWWGLAGVTSVTLIATLFGLHHSTRWIVGLMGDAAPITMYIPQLRKVFSGSDLTGVSIGSYWLVVITAVCWFTYGILLHQPAIYLPALVLVPASLIIIVRVKNSRGAEVVSA
ncbi:MAG: hypothetical protein WCL17_06750 [Actinomycetota bacterium]|jgi:uncharacterized protein with PQ loop repeat